MDRSKWVKTNLKDDEEEDEDEEGEEEDEDEEGEEEEENQVKSITVLLHWEISNLNIAWPHALVLSHLQRALFCWLFSSLFGLVACSQEIMSNV